MGSTLRIQAAWGGEAPGAPGCGPNGDESRQPAVEAPEGLNPAQRDSRSLKGPCIYPRTRYIQGRARPSGPRSIQAGCRSAATNRPGCGVPRDSGLPGFEEAWRALDSVHGEDKAHWALSSHKPMIHKDRPGSGHAGQHAHPARFKVDPNPDFNPACNVG
jgi:hypothetical protein